MKLIIVRHAKVNKKGKTAFGHKDVKLGRLGEIQAEELAQKLSGVKIDSIYSSPLMRAKQTAEIIASRHPGCKVVYTRQVREQNYGELEGIDLSKLADFRRKGWRVLHAPEGGETREEVCERARKFLGALKNGADETVLLVSHWVFNIALISILKKISPEKAWESLDIENAGVRVFEIGGGGVKAGRLGSLRRAGED